MCQPLPCTLSRQKTHLILQDFPQNNLQHIFTSIKRPKFALLEKFSNFCCNSKELTKYFENSPNLLYRFISNIQSFTIEIQGIARKNIYIEYVTQREDLKMSIVSFNQ